MTGRVVYPPYLPVFGTGAPGAGVPHTATYFDTSTTPFTPYIYSAGAWHTYGATGGGGNASSIQGVAVDTTAPTSGQVLKYNGTKWAPANAANTTSVVQVGGLGTNIGAVTLGAAPTAGNLLVGMACAGDGGNAAAGWTRLPANNNANWASIYYKIAGVGESATQTFASNTGTGGMVLFEILNGGLGMYWSAESPTQTNAFTFNTVRTFAAGQLVIGGVGSENSAVPTSFTNLHSGGSGSFAGAHAAAYFYSFEPTPGPCTVVANWAANQWNDYGVLTIFGA